MQCDICHRPGSSRLPFYCALCARDALYHQRIQLAQTLLHRESLGKEVEQFTTTTSKLKPSSSKASKPSESQPSPFWTIQNAAAGRVLSEEKTESTHYHVQILRGEIQNTKDDIAERRTRFHRRRSEFTSAKQELLQSQADGIEPVQKSIGRTQHNWDLMHKKTADSRLFLCREAALLYSLHQRKRRKGGLGRDVYYIGGVPIADLRDLNSMLIVPRHCLMLILPRCLPSSSQHLSHEPRPSCTSGVTLPIPSSPSRDHPSSQRLPFPYDFFT